MLCNRLIISWGCLIKCWYRYLELKLVGVDRCLNSMRCIARKDLIH